MTPQHPPTGMMEWIEWKGGECPLPVDTKVVVRLGDGRTMRRKAGGADWMHIGDGTDIIAYRIVEPGK